MRIFFFLLVTFVIINTLSSQNIRGVKPTTEYVYFVEKIMYIPFSYFDNKPNSDINFCKSHKKKYFINNMEISKEIFLDIGFKSKDLIDEVGKYRYIFSLIDKNKCVCETQYSVEINIPIIINGLAINKEELHKIDSQSIIKIKRKRRLFRKPIIVIDTKSL
jgi:hypothetical protein